jgi:hypothetical protein
MAGCVWAGAEWNRFDRAWKAIVRKLPSGSFHASDFECGQGSFKGAFTRSQTDGIQAQLISVIEDHEVFGYYSAVNRKAFARFETQIKRARIKYWSPYFLCFQQIMELCSSLVTGGLSKAAVSFIFDRQDEFQGRAREIFVSMKADRSTLHYKARLGTLTFSDRKQAAPLQAADFLAYECYKWLDKTQYGLSPPRWQWEMLNRGGRISGYEFEAGSMKRLVEAEGWDDNPATV